MTSMIGSIGKIIDTEKQDRIKNQIRQSKRRSNFELLRIIAMVMIIFHHLAYHTEFDDEKFSQINLYAKQIMTIGGKVGVNLFLLITGYFMSVKSTFSVRKVLRLLAEMWFYTFVTAVILDQRGELDEEFFETGSVFFPFMRGANWFSVTYICLYVFSGAINLIFENFSEKKLLGLIGFMLFMSVQFPIVFHNWNDPVIGESGGGAVFRFITMYLIGGYLRHYPHKILRSMPVLFTAAAGGFIGAYMGLHYELENFSFEQNNFFIVLWSVAMFMIFANIEISYKPAVNMIASCVFGVYLFHDNEYVRRILWEDISTAVERVGDKSFIPYCIGFVLAVFLVGTAIDMARQYILFKPFKLLNDRVVIPYFGRLRNVINGKGTADNESDRKHQA